MYSVAQLCLTLCDPLVYNLPGSSVHATFQGKLLYSRLYILTKLHLALSSLGAKGKRENTVVCMNEIFTIYEQNRK